jgi:tellurite resistance protein
MPNDARLLDRIAKRLSGLAPEADGDPGQISILASTANLYGARPESDDPAEPPTFDPAAAALFEAIVEAAYLVANADGVFDQTEQAAFREVVCAACGQAIPESQLGAILADLEQQLEDDGMDKRVRMVARTIATPEHAREVLRVAALIAHISEGVSEVEREVMLKLAGEFELGSDELDAALREVDDALKD